MSARITWSYHDLMGKPEAATRLAGVIRQFEGEIPCRPARAPAPQSWARRMMMEPVRYRIVAQTEAAEAQPQPETRAEPERPAQVITLDLQAVLNRSVEADALSARLQEILSPASHPHDRIARWSRLATLLEEGALWPKTEHTAAEDAAAQAPDARAQADDLSEVADQLMRSLSQSAAQRPHWLTQIETYLASAQAGAAAEPAPVSRQVPETAPAEPLTAALADAVAPAEVEAEAPPAESPAGRGARAAAGEDDDLTKTSWVAQMWAAQEREAQEKAQKLARDRAIIAEALARRAQEQAQAAAEAPAPRVAPKRPEPTPRASGGWQALAEGPAEGAPAREEARAADPAKGQAAPASAAQGELREGPSALPPEGVAPQVRRPPVEAPPAPPQGLRPPRPRTDPPAYGMGRDRAAALRSRARFEESSQQISFFPPQQGTLWRSVRYGVSSEPAPAAPVRRRPSAPPAVAAVPRGHSDAPRRGPDVGAPPSLHARSPERESSLMAALSTAHLKEPQRRPLTPPPHGLMPPARRAVSAAPQSAQPGVKPQAKAQAAGGSLSAAQLAQLKGQLSELEHRLVESIAQHGEMTLRALCSQLNLTASHVAELVRSVEEKAAASALALPWVMDWDMRGQKLWRWGA